MTGTDDPTENTEENMQYDIACPNCGEHAGFPGPREETEEWRDNAGEMECSCGYTGRAGIVTVLPDE